MSSPGWGHGRPKDGRYWTRPRVVSALRRYAAENPGPLPSSSEAWNLLKIGRFDLPVSQRILELWGSMRRAWLAVGVDRDRVTFLNSRWSKADTEYLLEHAGVLNLTTIAKHLGRTYASVKTKIGAKDLGITARKNQGFMSAAEVSREYGAPYARVQRFIETGLIKAEQHPRRQTWLIDPGDISADVAALLRGEKRTHKTTPVDLGDYRARYGIRRVSVSA